MNIEEKDFNFIQHSKYDISVLKNIVEKLDKEWEENTSRQEKTYSQKDTQSINIVDFSLQWTPGSTYDPKFVLNNTNLFHEINLIIKDLENKLDGKVGRVLLTKLLPNKKISQHKDYQRYLVLNNRCHIPIITNEKVNFIVGEESINMKEGDCWEINNARVHSVINDSDQDRIHLIVDIISNSYL
jgi:hypothetical protein